MHEFGTSHTFIHWIYKFQLIARVPSRVWGRHAPTRTLRKLARVEEVKSRMDRKFSRTENLWPRDDSCSQLISSNSIFRNCFQIVKTHKRAKNFFLLKWWCSRWAPPLFRFVFLANRCKTWYIYYTKLHFERTVHRLMMCKVRCLLWPP